MQQDLKMLVTGLMVVLVSVSSIHAKEDDDVSMSCNKHDVFVSIPKQLIPDFSLDDLSLMDSKCDYEHDANYTHFKLVVPLIGCGTVSRHTNKSVIYTNMIKNKPFDDSAVINRLPVVEIPITCTYPKKIAASYTDLNVKDTVLQLDVEDGSGEFDLQMGLFLDSTFVDQHVDFPVTVPLNQRLYFQLNVDSIDKGLSVLADTCYATPTRAETSVNKYLIIEERCPKDSTFKSHPSPPWAQRFSFQAFQFVYSTDIPYVFIHCEVRLCNATDEESSCSKGCEDKITDVKLRQRRHLEEDTYTLERGPIVIITDDGRWQGSQTIKQKDSALSPPEAVLIGVGVICLLCLVVVLYTRRQLIKIRSHNRTTKL